MQNVNFNSVEEFLDFLPDDELQIVEHLRKLIFASMPTCIEHLSYNVPYYKSFRDICFIWPSSVLWGKKKTYDGVRLGFTAGHLLADESGYLDKGNRKYVYWRDFKSISEIDNSLLKSYFFEAFLIDQEKRKKQTQK